MCRPLIILGLHIVFRTSFSFTVRDHISSPDKTIVVIHFISFNIEFLDVKYYELNSSMYFSHLICPHPPDPTCRFAS